MPDERLDEADERIDKRYTEGKLMAIVQEDTWNEYISERMKEYGEINADWFNKRSDRIKKENPEIFDLMQIYFIALKENKVSPIQAITLAVHVYDLLEYQAGKYRKEDFEKILEEMKPEESKEHYIQKMILLLKNHFLTSS